MAVTCFIFGPIAMAQNDTSKDTTDTFTLEEITVTAEKRAVNVQSIAASVQVVSGSDLTNQGKFTTAQMLESVPNVKFSAALKSTDDPNSNIIIRGVQKTQEAGGGAPVPSSTATYVDGVYGGIGGDFDVNRIEVLRGPQGTLYGRSAAGGVVAFHTNDPKLNEFGGEVLADYGTGNRIDTQAALNVPAGDTLALRAAVHYFHQKDGYWDGPELETKAARIKALYQPNEKFTALLSLTAERAENYGGGWSWELAAPNKIVHDSYLEPSKAAPTDYRQGSLELNYHLGGSTLTYIAALHTLDNRGPGVPTVKGGDTKANVISGDPSKTLTHEFRWASDKGGPLSWLIGASYYKYTYNINNAQTQINMSGSPDPNVNGAPMFVEKYKGSVTEYGIFTEETYELRDDMRITAGLRYDKNTVDGFSAFDFNANLLSWRGASLNPPIWLKSPYDENKPTFNNLTYKLRFEYDLTPENMLYATTATGYIPGMSQISPQPVFAFGPGGGPPSFTGQVNFITLPFSQEKLTSYEVGSKNRFLDNKLQINGDIFYLNYEGYQEAVNLTPDQPPPPEYIVLPVPVKMVGLEMDMVWLISQRDKLTFSGGWLDAEITDYPDIPGAGLNTRDLMYLKRVPGIPEVTATLAYDHTFLLGNGSSLVPRVEARYSSGYYVEQRTLTEVEYGLLPYDHQDSTVIINMGATWSSPQEKYSITAYVRNATDEDIKTKLDIPDVISDPPPVQLGEPRTYGVMVGVKF